MTTTSLFTNTPSLIYQLARNCTHDVLLGYFRNEHSVSVGFTIRNLSLKPAAHSNLFSHMLSRLRLGPIKALWVFCGLHAKACGTD